MAVFKDIVDIGIVIKEDVVEALQRTHVLSSQSNK
jgi:hypothetical protein